MKPLLPLLCLFALIQSAFPWGSQGHQAVGEVARQLLTFATRAKIIEILGNDDLGAVSTWLDDVRNQAHHHTGPLKNDPEAKAFNKQHPKNDQWHYVDLPVGSSIYAPDGPFSSPDDVVHAIGAAVDVLEGKSKQFTKAQALRILVHLVADVHQPLHTVAGYFDCTDPTDPKLNSDPALAQKLPHDRGGNQLFYTKTLELHALWDAKLVSKLAHAKTPAPLAALLMKDCAVDGFKTPGDYHTWPAKWGERLSHRSHRCLQEPRIRPCNPQGRWQNQPHRNPPICGLRRATNATGEDAARKILRAFGSAFEQCGV